MEIKNSSTSSFNKIKGDALTVRKAVFVTEQNIDINLELDDLDDDSMHFVAYVDGLPAATARIHQTNDNGWHIQRVATLKEFRHQGLARAIMLNMEALAREKHITYLTLGAQLSAEAFYRKLAFTPEGAIFLDANIQHIKMCKIL